MTTTELEAPALTRSGLLVLDDPTFTPDTVAVGHNDR